MYRFLTHLPITYQALLANSYHRTESVAVLRTEVTGQTQSELQVPCLWHDFLHFQQYRRVMMTFWSIVIALVLGVIHHDPISKAENISANTDMMRHHSRVIQGQER